MRGSSEVVTRFVEACRELGVETSATVVEVKQAYRRCTRERHPDVTESADGAAFRRAREARDFLLDEGHRWVFGEVIRRRQAKRRAQVRAAQAPKPPPSPSTSRPSPPYPLRGPSPLSRLMERERVQPFDVFMALWGPFFRAEIARYYRKRSSGRS